MTLTHSHMTLTQSHDTDTQSHDTKNRGHSHDTNRDTNARDSFMIKQIQQRHTVTTLTTEAQS